MVTTGNDEIELNDNPEIIIKKKPVSKRANRIRSIAFVALTIAIMAVSASISIPIGPIPFTLQMFAVTFAIVVLTPPQAIAAIAGYLALGAIGLPFFSGLRGGIGVLAGPTGGFLWGYLLGGSIAVLFLYLMRNYTKWGRHTYVHSNEYIVKNSQTRLQKVRTFFEQAGIELIAGVIFTAISYFCGTIQYMAVAAAPLGVALAVCVLPFIVVDACKIVAAVICARAVLTAVRH